MAKYEIVPEMSKVRMDATSNVHPIHNESRALEGSIDAEVEGGKLVLGSTPSATVSFAVDSLKSGNALEDRELRKRIESKKYPTIEAKLTGLEETEREGVYLARGEITFKGVTNTYEDEVTFTADGDDSIRFDGESTFDIRDFGMDPPKVLMLKVDPDVKISVEVVAKRTG
ncbi:MAG: YceI family protein [Acidimicrobiia bacterium]